MVELLRPDVFIEEKAAAPSLQNLPVNTAGFVIASQKGPVNEPVLVTSFTQFGEIFGSFYQGYYGPHALRLFFAEGGARAFVVRVVGSGAAKSSVVAKDTQGTPANTLQINALNEGAWGNFLSVSFVKFSSKVKNALAAGATNTIVLEDVTGLEVGDYIEVDGGAGNDKFYRVVYSIDVATNTVTFDQSYTVVTGVPAGSSVKTVSMHRAKSNLKADVAAGAATSVAVEDPRNFRVGQLVYMMDGTSAVEVVLTGINGDQLLFASTTLPALTAATSVVVSQEFIMRVYDSGRFVEKFEYLSLSSYNKDDYVESKLRADNNISKFIEVTDLGAGDLLVNMPEPKSIALSGGLDGAVPAAGDYVGDPLLGTGLYAFDKLTTPVNFFAVPGVAVPSVHSALIAFAESSSKTHGSKSMAIIEAPLSADAALEAISYKEVDLNKDSSYAAIYYPWIKIIDPENPDREIIQPPSGAVAGVWARVGAGPGIQKAPANEEILSAFGLTHDTTDGEHDILNSKNINVIKSVPGSGIRIMGARTLQSAANGFHYINVRRVVNDIKAVLQQGLRGFLFSEISPALYDAIRSVVTSFLQNRASLGQLVSTTTAQGKKLPAYFVKVDEENNTADDVAAGRVNVAIGLNPVRPAEFIVLSISLIDGSVVVSE